LHAEGPQRDESRTRALGRPELQLGGQHDSQDDDDGARQPQRVRLQPDEVTHSRSVALLEPVQMEIIQIRRIESCSEVIDVDIIPQTNRQRLPSRLDGCWVGLGQRGAGEEGRHEDATGHARKTIRRDHNPGDPDRTIVKHLA
jgi:hypothetical protein